MARTFYLITLCSAALLAASQANALQLTNRDATQHAIIVNEGGAAQNLVAKPSEMIDGICMKGCTIKMPDGEEYDFDGTEVVSIEEGLMFMDGSSDDVGGDTGADSIDALPDGTSETQN